MNKNKNDLIVIYKKDRRMNTIEITQQTKYIRETTNQKIRELGNKYYTIKNLFDKMNLKRDDLFLYGKQLVEEFKQKKKGIKLQNSKKRMKDALLCWFTENFYDEIIQPGSIILHNLAQISIHSQCSSIQQKLYSVHNLTQTMKKKQKLCKNDEPKLEKENEQLIYFKVNNEIDRFDEFYLLTNNSQKEGKSINSYFDFNALLNM